MTKDTNEEDVPVDVGTPVDPAQAPEASEPRVAKTTLSQHAPQQSTYETPAPQRDVRNF
jgi:hypothetical protein